MTNALTWVLGFIDRHPGWAVVWLVVVVAGASRVLIALKRAAQSVADWLHPPRGKR